MGIKPWGQSFLKIILILLLIYGANSIFTIIDLKADLTYNPQLWERTSMALFSYGGIGVILGFNHFTSERKKTGIWKVDWPKLIMLGVPSLFYSSLYVIGAYANPFFGRILFVPVKPLLMNDLWIIVCLFSLILGHTITTGFYKYDADHTEMIHHTKTGISKDCN